MLLWDFFTGFCRRLTEELRQTADIRPRYQDLRPVLDAKVLCVVNDIGCPRNIATWVGGSILAVIEVSKESWRQVVKDGADFLTLRVLVLPGDNRSLLVRPSVGL